MNNTLIQYFHWYSEGNGQLYSELASNAAHLEELGITAVWLPPAYKSAGGGYSVGYDPYDLYDLGEFDQKGGIPTKYGTKESYLEAIKTIKEHHIQLIVDVVLNHKAGGDELEKFNAIMVNEDNRDETVSEPFEIESYTKFTFAGRGTQYSDFVWDFNCFSGVDYAEGQPKAIYRVLNEYTEKGWDQMISNEKGNYDYLMYNDIEHRNPFVREELNHWGKWYFDTTDFDGVRLDAVKHVGFDFFKEWLTLLRSNTGKNIFAVGEYWAPGQLDLLQNYIASTEGSMSLFDSCLQHNFYEASHQGGNYDLRTIFDNTLTQHDPLHAVTVVGNHDTQPLQALEAEVQAWFKPIAYALILLRKDGYPCIFYPDLFGAHYQEGDHEIFLEKAYGIETLIKARKDHAYGDQKDYFEDANCLGWIRFGDNDHKACAVTLSNKDAYEKPMEIGELYQGQSFCDVMGHFPDHEVIIDDQGWGQFPVPAGNVSVWLPKNAQS